MRAELRRQAAPLAQAAPAGAATGAPASKRCGCRVARPLLITLHYHAAVSGPCTPVP